MPRRRHLSRTRPAGCNPAATEVCGSPVAVRLPTETCRVGKDPAFVAGLERMSGFGRLGRVDEIADVVAFDGGAAARWINGQNIRINGVTV